MTLTEWLDRNGKGTGGIQRLSARAEVSLPVIARAREGRATLASATKLHLATGCEVPISSMTRDAVPEALEPRRARRAGKVRKANARSSRARAVAR